MEEMEINIYFVKDDVSNKLGNWNSQNLEELYTEVIMKKLAVARRGKQRHNIP